MSIHPDIVVILEASGYKITDIPKLNIGQRVGGTGYIDFIKSSEMKSSIMRGVDRYNRAFISFDIQCDGEKAGDEGGRGVITCFQRYTDDVDKWCIGGDVYGAGSARSSLARYPVPIKWLQEMLTGKNRFRLADKNTIFDHQKTLCDFCNMWLVDGSCKICANE